MMTLIREELRRAPVRTCASYPCVSIFKAECRCRVRKSALNVVVQGYQGQVSVPRYSESGAARACRSSIGSKLELYELPAMLIWPRPAPPRGHNARRHPTARRSPPRSLTARERRIGARKKRDARCIHNRAGSARTGLCWRRHRELRRSRSFGTPPGIPASNTRPRSLIQVLCQRGRPTVPSFGLRAARCWFHRRDVVARFWFRLRAARFWFHRTDDPLDFAIPLELDPVLAPKNAADAVKGFPKALRRTAELLPDLPCLSNDLPSSRARKLSRNSRRPEPRNTRRPELGTLAESARAPRSMISEPLLSDTVQPDQSPPQFDKFAGLVFDKSQQRRRVGRVCGMADTVFWHQVRHLVAGRLFVGRLGNAVRLDRRCFALKLGCIVVPDVQLRLTCVFHGTFSLGFECKSMKGSGQDDFSKLS